MLQEELSHNSIHYSIPQMQTKCISKEEQRQGHMDIYIWDYIKERRQKNNISVPQQYKDVHQRPFMYLYGYIYLHSTKYGLGD